MLGVNGCYLCHFLETHSFMLSYHYNHNPLLFVFMSKLFMYMSSKAFTQPKSKNTQGFVSQMFQIFIVDLCTIPQQM
jgi:hypothetical protein